MKIIKPSAELWSITPNAVALIERAGRVCYQSEPKGDPESFVRMLIRRGHESVLEHASATISVITDRGVSHELVRHRLASFSQESTRYVNYGNKEIEFIEPWWWEDSPRRYAERADFDDAMRVSRASYELALLRGQSPQAARAVLPSALKTQIVVTANFREWRHIFKLRCASAAHPDMIRVMSMARDLLVMEVPCVFAETEAQ